MLNLWHGAGFLLRSKAPRLQATLGGRANQEGHEQQGKEDPWMKLYLVAWRHEDGDG